MTKIKQKPGPKPKPKQQAIITEYQIDISRAEIGGWPELTITLKGVSNSFADKSVIRKAIKHFINEHFK